MKEKNKAIQKSRLSNLREVHGVAILSSLKDVKGQGAIQDAALLQAVCEYNPESCF